jgi:hypothetical protein
VDDSGVGGFDFDLPTRKKSKKVGVVARGDFFGVFEGEEARDNGDGFVCAGGRK